MIKLYWRDEAKTILIREMEPTWTWEEYEAGIETMKAMISEVAHPVFVIVDSRKVIHSSDVPTDAFNHFNDASKDLPDNAVAQVIVSRSKWLEAIGAILKHLAPEEHEKLIVVRTMEKADRQIERLKVKMKKRKPRHMGIVA